MTTIDTSDSRFPKAVALADNAGQWLKCRATDSRKAYGVPSQCTAGRYYLTTQTSCTCEDAKRHAPQICKHSLAVQIHCARVAGKPMPASDVVDGLAEMVAEHNPTLTMVRHPDGEISWERHVHANGDIVHLPAARANAAKYDRIFKRFGEE